MPKLSLDDAVAEFHKTLRAELARLGPAFGAKPALYVPEKPGEAERRHFALAELLLRLACPELCKDPRCRRAGVCRHLIDLDARRRAPRPVNPESRRPPSADAARHAMWVFMNKTEE
jgi:hypothetical protein